MPDLDQSATARKDPDVDKQARQWAEKIERDHGLLSQHYSKILTKRQLEREYHTFTQRRALASAYELFLVDVRVVNDEWEERDTLKPTIDPAKLKRKHAIKKKRQQKLLAQRRIKSGERVALKPGGQVKSE
ncbi:hypothetical protein OESDEN_08270 [Oesophagostomum dentatum]|uniref:Uncharacterized protein n=1 Tax=Oesophagostomum dentatum TaxID=61180 RepID=A0A0B1T8Z0_OESDE|nr:hypothetical protein OESDEN_08270 [Oesophagostomum dentatum]